MELAIIVPIVGGFGKKGFYNSQEIGLGKELSKLGHRVTIYKCIKSKEQYVEELIDKNINIKYIPSKSLGVHGYFNTDYLSDTVEGVFIFSDTQIFIKHIFDFCKRKNIKLVPYVGIAHSFKSGIKSKIMNILFRCITLNIYKKVEVLAKTNAVKEELYKLGVKSCIVAPVGLDFTVLKEDYLKINRNKLRDNWGYNIEDNIILFVARLAPEKRPIDMLRIFREIRNNKKVKLLVVGTGILQHQMIKFIEENHLQNDVKILNKVPYEQMWELYYISDYFVSLRKDEIFGMAVMEAIYYMSNVVAIHAPGPDTILGKMEGHILCNSDDEIIKYIENMIPDENLLIKSKEKLVNSFSWKCCSEAFCKILNSNLDF